MSIRYRKGATVYRNGARGRVLRCLWLIDPLTKDPARLAYEIRFDDSRRLIVLASEVESRDGAAGQAAGSPQAVLL